MRPKMFCYQCQETVANTGCTLRGVCGKDPTVSAAMDLLLFVVRGVSVVSTRLDSIMGDADCKRVNRFITDSLFCTITNANFSYDSIVDRICRGIELRNSLLTVAGQRGVDVPMVDEVIWNGLRDDCASKARSVGVLAEPDEDLRSLKQLILYGLKGMAAYLYHAMQLGHDDTHIHHFMQSTLASMTLMTMATDELLGLTLQVGEYGVKAMALLDAANTQNYGNPVVTHVNLGVGYRSGILISGHDIHDLMMLLEQSEGQGIDVYTHGEMLPAHYYPAFRRFPHFIGNYGGAWWQQHSDFEAFGGPILFTSNCIVPPPKGAGYSTRVFTTNSSSYPGWRHIEADENGRKDFTEIINEARRSRPPRQIEKGTIIGGYAHNQMEQIADSLISAVRSGDIRRIIVMAGCDGRMPNRRYYTEFAAQLPHDALILTAGCAKYRYIKLDLGTINGIPRVLDAGQCNDCYSIVLTALRLRDALGLTDINELPVTYNIAWYEQKAIIVLLALLSLGVKDIHLGPTLPAFLSPYVRSVLTEHFGLSTISTAQSDLEEWGLNGLESEVMD